MLKVEREEIVVLRLCENKRRKIIRQIMSFIVCKSLCDWIDDMVENLDGFKNNPEDRYDNPKYTGFRLVLNE